MASVSFRLLPSAFVDIRDVCGRQMEAGELLGIRQKNSLNIRKEDGVGKLLLPSSSVDIRDVCGRKMGRGELLGKRQKITQNGRG